MEKASSLFKFRRRPFWRISFLIIRLGCTKRGGERGWGEIRHEWAEKAVRTKGGAQGNTIAAGGVIVCGPPIG